MPHRVGEMAHAYVTGLQSQNVSAMVKHFVSLLNQPPLHSPSQPALISISHSHTRTYACASANWFHRLPLPPPSKVSTLLLFMAESESYVHSTCLPLSAPSLTDKQPPSCRPTILTTAYLLLQTLLYSPIFSEVNGDIKTTSFPMLVEPPDWTMHSTSVAQMTMTVSSCRYVIRRHQSTQNQFELYQHL